MLPDTTNWEVRKLGNALNGAGFDPALGGADYSQQDAAQLSLSDISCDQYGSTLTSAAGGFTEAMLGNVLYISGGENFDPGYYEIISYNDTYTIDVDRSPCSAGAGTNGVIKVGGASDHPYTIISKMDSIQAKMYIKKGTYDYVSNPFSCIVNCSYFPEIEGYNAVRGDKPILSSDMPQFNGLDTADHGFYGGSFIVTSCAVYDVNAYGFYVDSLNMVATNCIAHDAASGGFFANQLLRATNCIAYSTGGAGFYATSITAIGCVSNDNAGEGFSCITLSVINCLAYNNGTDGFYSSNVFFASGCVSINNQIGFNFANYIFICGCIAYNNTSIGFYQVSATEIFFDLNCYYGNSTDLSGVTEGPHDVAADPLFTNPSSTPPNLTLQTSSPCKNVDYPPTPMIGGAII